MSHCRYLSHFISAHHSWSVASCQFTEIPYVPSVRELEIYCKADRHHRCPAVLRSGPVVYEQNLWPELEVIALARAH